jgi:penicillin-binding protein 1C
MKKYLKRISITLVSLIVSAWAILFFLPMPPLLQETSFSRAVYDTHHRLLRLTLSQDEKYRLFTSISAIPPTLIAATLLQEDQYFQWHYGVNPFSLIKAGWQTFFLKTRRIGASTITMQLARIRFHLHSKTIVGKLQQLLRATQLEMHYTKNQILEAYLNLAPYGNNIEGVGAASLIYFNKPVKDIALPEALTLSVIPQNPNERHTDNLNLKNIRNKLYMRWVKLHPADIRLKLLTTLPLQMQHTSKLPFLAPHFVNRILKNSLTHTLNTTLDWKLQRIIEQVTHRYIMRKTIIGIHNAAVLLVDTRDMGIKALVGSADFFNASIQGQINGTEIKRSPGSTLKPFIYGLALDQGLIHPNTILKDVPHSFGNYNPENFDYEFMGPIHAKDALVLSRNLPAIYLADQLRQPNLYTFLESANIKNLKPEKYYGLTLALGGAEISMQELTSLYAMLANDGVWHPLRSLADEPITTGNRLLSPEASFLIVDMLKNTPPLDENNSNQLPVAWKTGTSSGFRDAWSIGIVGPYVVAVWIGNFNQSSNAAFIGKSATAPLLFEIINALNTQAGPLPLMQKYPERLHLKQIEVCKESGMLPTRYCPKTELTWFIPGKSPIKTDTIYREIAIDKQTGLRACQLNKNTRFETYEFWSSDLLKIFKQAGLPRRSPPPYDASCSVGVSRAGMDPQIISPQTDLTYVMRANAKEKTLLPLMATADADVTTLFWFMNETYLGKTPRDTTYWWKLKPGKYVVRVADDHGRTHARELLVVVSA